MSSRGPGHVVRTPSDATVCKRRTAQESKDLLLPLTRRFWAQGLAAP